MNELRRLLWKHDARMLASEKLDQSFMEHIASLITSYSAHNKNGTSPAAASSISRLRKRFDQAINSARYEGRAHNYHAALRSLRKAAATLARLQAFTAAEREIELAQTSYDELLKRTRESLDTNLLTCRIPGRLLAKARELLDRQEAWQSRFVAAMCKRESERLLSTDEPASAEASQMHHQIAQMKKLNELLQCVPWTAGGESIENMLRQIEALMLEGHNVLAKCLLDDLERATGHRRAFICELTRQAGTPTAAKREQVTALLEKCGVTNQDSWESATCRLLEGTLAGLERRVEMLRSRNSDIQAAAGQSG